MDFALAQRVLEESFATGEFGELDFTGGEALTQRREVLALATRAAANGYWVSIVSNSFWASSPDAANRLAAEMRQSGVAQLKLSTSRFHREFIPPSYVANAWRAAVSVGISVLIIHTALSDDEVPAPELSACAVEYPETLWVKFVIEPAGRAAALQLPAAGEAELDLRCPEYDRLVVDYDGRAYPCCSVHGFFPELATSDLQTQSLQGSLQRRRLDPLQTLIEKDGFAPLLDALGVTPRDLVPEGVLATCRICRSLRSGPLETRAREAASALLSSGGIP